MDGAQPESADKSDQLKTLIVILNWNTYEMTRECVQSLSAMTGDSFEILIVDNGSHDGSLENLRHAFPQLTIIANGRNLGFAAGANVGMKRALDQGADYVLLVNNDTVVQPDLLAELLAEAKRTPQAGMISPKIYYADPPDRIWWAGGKFNFWQGIPRHLGRKEKESGQLRNRPHHRLGNWLRGIDTLCRSARGWPVRRENVRLR